MLIVTNAVNSNGIKIINMACVHRIYVDTDKKGEAGVRAEMPDGLDLLGRYSSVQRCEEVMEQIISCYANFFQSEGLADKGIVKGVPFAFSYPKIFKMPEE